MKSRAWTSWLFVFYILILIWIIIFKMNITSTLMTMHFNLTPRRLNLIPFAGTAIYNGQLDYEAIGLNVIFVIPFGIYLSLLFRRSRSLINIIGIAVTSLMFEVIQYMLNIGVADITDVMTNVTGGLLGILCYSMLTKWLKDKTDYWLNLIATVLTSLIMIIIVVMG